MDLYNFVDDLKGTSAIDDQCKSIPSLRNRDKIQFELGKLEKLKAFFEMETKRERLLSSRGLGKDARQELLKLSMTRLCSMAEAALRTAEEKGKVNDDAVLALIRQIEKLDRNGAQHNVELHEEEIKDLETSINALKSMFSDEKEDAEDNEFSNDDSVITEELEESEGEDEDTYDIPKTII